MVFPCTATVDVVAFSLMHAETWFAGKVYGSEHALQLLWRLTYQDYINGKDQVWQVFTVYVDSFVAMATYFANGEAVASSVLTAHKRHKSCSVRGHLPGNTSHSGMSSVTQGRAC